MNRGIDMMKRAEQAQKTKSDKSWDWKYQLRIEPEDGPVPLRYRGVLLDIPYKYPDDELRSFSKDQLAAVLVDVGGTYASDMNLEELRKQIKARYAVKEPFFYGRHFARRNMGNKAAGGPFINCGDSAALSSEDQDVVSTCRVCHAIDEGDSSINRSSSFAFTFWDYRGQHVIKKGKDAKNEYVACTMATKRHCEHCSHNTKVADPKSNNFRTRYDNGNRYLAIPISVAKALIACEQRVTRRCKSCRVGELAPVGAYCPNEACYQPFDFDGLLASGWDPDNRGLTKCHACKLSVTPELQYECSHCQTPTASRLYDVDLLVSVTKEGAADKQRTNYQFVEQMPVKPLDPFNDKTAAKILATPMLVFEELLGPPTVQEQLRWIGVHNDPMTAAGHEEEPANEGPPERAMRAPTPPPGRGLPTVVPPRRGPPPGPSAPQRPAAPPPPRTAVALSGKKKGIPAPWEPADAPAPAPAAKPAMRFSLGKKKG